MSSTLRSPGSVARSGVHTSILTTTHTLVLPAWEVVLTPTESSRPCSSFSPPSPLLKPLPRTPATALRPLLPLSEGGRVSMRSMLREEASARAHELQVTGV